MTLMTLHDAFPRNIPFYSHARRFYREECVTMRHASLGWLLFRVVAGAWRPGETSDNLCSAKVKVRGVLVGTNTSI